MSKSMTSGNPLKLILAFSIPLLLGNLFQQFYNIVDTAIVGQTLGSVALAGVGSSSSVQFLVLGFCQGICQGFSIPVAQKFGADEIDEMRKYVFNGGVFWNHHHIYVSYGNTEYFGFFIGNENSNGDSIRNYGIWMCGYCIRICY